MYDPIYLTLEATNPKNNSEFTISKGTSGSNNTLNLTLACLTKKDSNVTIILNSAANPPSGWKSKNPGKTWQPNQTIAFGFVFACNGTPSQFDYSLFLILVISWGIIYLVSKYAEIWG